VLGESLPALLAPALPAIADFENVFVPSTPLPPARGTQLVLSFSTFRVSDRELTGAITGTPDVNLTKKTVRTATEGRFEVRRNGSSLGVMTVDELTALLSHRPETRLRALQSVRRSLRASLRL
jgi:hypothetical protein